MSKNSESQAKKCASVGGQALVEGVMMRSPSYTAIAVRRMDNKKISVKRDGNKSISDKYKFLKWPMIRGTVNFIESMKISLSTMTKATDMLGLEVEEENASKFDKWVDKHLGKWALPVITAFSMILGVAISVALFVFLPTLLGKVILGWEAYETNTEFWFGALKSLIEGVAKVIIFILYIWLTSLIPDMKRVYMYHGAEHKSIFCYEKGLELNVENVRAQRRFHPRCGTSFMFSMILLSIFIGIVFLFDVKTVWLRTLLKLALLPITVGIGYEFIRYAGKHDNRLVRILAAPGLWMQRLTTREPDDSMIEVGITSLKCALPDEFPGFYEECLEAMKAEEPSPEAPSDEAPEEPSGQPENADPELAAERETHQEKEPETPEDQGNL
ncbi:MAG: DUF1385 domain-containing protein [Clostridia bacterium]|nr:DUF1385 domain-containing protein [Clostridia bacterium]